MKHIDSHLHVTGKSQYVDDVPAPSDMLHCAVYGSPVAHGNIRSLDLSAARSAKGVSHILTQNDIPGNPIIGVISKDEPLFAGDTVNFHGQPIALIIADTAENARAAARVHAANQQDGRG